MIEEENVQFKGLSNEEIIFLYYTSLSRYNKKKEELDKGVISKKIPTPVGDAVMFRKISNEHVEKYKNTNYYKLLISTIEKLKPIVEILQDIDEYKKLIEEVK